MAQFIRTIPDEQVGLFLSALAWKYGGYPEEVGIKNETGPGYTYIPNPDDLRTWVGKKVDAEWKLLIEKYERHIASESVTPTDLNIT